MIIYTSSEIFNPNIAIAPTWSRIEGKFLFGATNGSTINEWTIASTGDSYQIGTIGGEVTHKLTVNELAKHSHKARYNTTTLYYGDSTSGGIFQGGGSAFTYIPTSKNVGTDTGNDQPHNNMPPFKAVYIWERTA